MDAYKPDCFLAKIEFDDHHHTLKEKSKKALLDLVALIDQIAATGEDNRREFWFCLPSVPYKNLEKVCLMRTQRKKKFKNGTTRHTRTTSAGII